jgi:hypothetical protein
MWRGGGVVGMARQWVGAGDGGPRAAWKASWVARTAGVWAAGEWQWPAVLPVCVQADEEGRR